METKKKGTLILKFWTKFIIISNSQKWIDCAVEFFPEKRFEPSIVAAQVLTTLNKVENVIKVKTHMTAKQLTACRNQTKV